MNANRPNRPVPSNRPEDLRRDRPTTWPFFVALSIFLIGLVGVVVVSRVNSTSDNLTDEQWISRVASDYAEVTNHDDGRTRAKITCADFSEADDPLRENDALLKNVSIKTVDDIRITGDTASARVGFTADDRDGTQVKTFNYRKVDGTWTVCKPA